MPILFIPFLWLIFGILVAVIANSKGRGGCTWFIIGVLLGPFGLIVAFLPATEKSGSMKKCPFCSEIVKWEARVCKHCHKDLPEPPEKPSVWKRHL